MSDNKCFTCQHNRDFLEVSYGSRCTTCVGFREYEPAPEHGIAPDYSDLAPGLRDMIGRMENKNQPRTLVQQAFQEASDEVVGDPLRQAIREALNEVDVAYFVNGQGRKISDYRGTAKVAKVAKVARPKNLKKYLPLAKAVAELSKDGSSKVGALILGYSGEVRASGWNGSPRGCSADEEGDIRSIRPAKYFWFSHAELNAITNAARVGTPLEGCSIVVTHFPCMDCARAIVQSGISKVLCPSPSGEFAERWSDSIAMSRSLFVECGVELEEVSL